MLSPAATSTSSIISALGAGSGIDMTALANNLAVAQFSAQTARLTAKSETLDRQISLGSTIISMLQGLSSSLATRVRVGDLSPQPAIANSAVASATLNGSATPSGHYSLEVSALASAQTLASPAFAAATSTAGSGTLTLRFGTIGNSFAEDPAHTAVDIVIPAGASLSDIAAAINGKSAGVNAYVANTTSGAKLVLKGSDGASNGFVLQATEAPGDPGLAALAWDPASGTPDRLPTAASDAQFKLDGLPIKASGNSVSNAVPGLDLKLTVERNQVAAMPFVTIDLNVEVV